MKRLVTFLLLMIFFFYANAQTTETVEITTRPWNGYWWPLNNNGLCTGQDYNKYPSPMEKYDMALNQKYHATTWEINNHYFPDAPYWWGHCNGWAVASILEQEPTHKSTFNSIVFYVGDLKGLLSECHQGASGTTYGTRYMGDDNQQAFDDINPLDLQNVLKMYLKDNNTPILIDADPTKEIWTYPVYKYELSYTDEGNTRHCTLTVYCATDSYDNGILNPDDFGDTHSFTKTYTYDLTLDSNGDPVSGEWTGNSVNDHPDFAWYPDNDAGKNPYVSLAQVHSIMSNDYSDEDDPNEPDNDFEHAKPLDTNKIYRIENDDYFTMFIEPGEDVTLSMTFNDYFHYEVVKYYDSEQNYLGFFPFNSIDKDVNYRFTGGNEITNYYLNVKYPVTGDYNDNYMFKAHENYTKIIIPHTLETSYWDNFVYAGFIPYTKKNSDTNEETEILNANGSYVGVFNENNRMVPETMLPTIQFSPAFTEIPLNDSSNNTPEWIKVNTTDAHVKLLSFYQSHGDGSMGYFYSIQPAKRFVLPHVPSHTNYWWYGIVIVNPSHFKSINVFYKLYDYHKHILKEGTLYIPQYGKIVDVFENIFPDVEMGQTSYIEFYSKDNFIVSALYGTRNHRELAYVPADSRFINEGEKVYVTKDLMPQTDNPWAGIAIVNPTESYSKIYISVVNNHNAYTRYYLTLYPHEKKVDVLENFLPDGYDYSTLERIEFEVIKGSISMFALYGDHDQGMLASLIPPQWNNGMETYFFPNIQGHSLSTTLKIKNEANYSIHATVYAIDANGNEIEHQTYTLSNFELRSIDISGDFSTDPSQIKTLKVYSSRFITPFAEIKSDDGKFYEIIGPVFKKETVLIQNN